MTSTLVLASLSKCGLSEELRFCRPACEPSCADLHPICPATCGLAVCMCQRGFVRQSGMCIPMSACKFFDLEPLTKKKVEKRIDSPKGLTKKPPSKPPVIAKASSTAVLHRPLHPPPNCGQGQQFTRCVCDATCNRSKICDTCSSGCGCFLHHVRNDEGICVLFRDCPFPRPTKKPTAMVLFTSLPEESASSLERRKEIKKTSREITESDGAFKGSAIRIIPTRPLARAVKTITVKPRTGPKRKTRRPSSVSRRMRQKFGKVTKAAEVVKGPQPPPSAPRFSTGESAQPIKPKKTAKKGKSGPAPPAAIPPRAKPLRRGPPSVRPLNFGPPGITPVVFFRSRRIARKERALHRLRMRAMARRVV
ncbi:trypsin Inhibitor like cysteine rich domain protein [Ancylostoma caninum]|uniref:Trypsin Inhibitor like cysteine rich domain protein n=1 Tax=Ancylostoma caninum TaxID=29170 RepID=A0A368GP01_ANCCA|nr:trypsin Inhibitor like cysteine rich domain protein [Ancylostoma caninum]